MTTRALDPAEIIDRSPVSGYQWMIFVLCALVAALDGFDTQAIGYTAPILAGMLHVPPPALAPVFSIGLVGASIGALAVGPIADRYGRKGPLLISCLIFAVFSLATIKVESMSELLTLRFLAGIGLGGATPSFLALGAEYAPTRLRSFIVTTCWSAFPFGGFIGGMTASYLIPVGGWQAVFMVGGIAPIVVAIILALALPESLRFLAAKGADDARIGRIVRRIDPSVPAGTPFRAHESAAGPKIGALFTQGRGVHTLVLWVPFFMTFMILLTVTAWTPSLLHFANIPVTAAALVLAANNLGSVVGNSLAGYLVDRFGAFRILLPACVLGAVSLAYFGYAATSVPLLACVSASAGFFVGGASAGCIALAARIYPTRIRSTGIGWGMGMGRLGQILGPLGIGALLAAKASIVTIFVAASVPCLIAGVAVILLVRLPKLEEAEAL